MWKLQFGHELSRNDQELVFIIGNKPKAHVVSSRHFQTNPHLYLNRLCLISHTMVKASSWDRHQMIFDYP